MRTRSGLHCSGWRILVAFVFGMLATPAAAPAPGDNPCDPGEEPDVIVSDIYETDWPGAVNDDDVPSEVVWQTATFLENPNANALRWNTLYNFRFDANLPPVTGNVELGLFRLGLPTRVTARTWVPAPCNEYGTCDLGEDVCECVHDCVPPVAESFCADGLDDDCDGRVDCFDPDCCVGSECDSVDYDSDGVGICYDCSERDEHAWSRPGEVRNLEFRSLFNQIALSWTAPEEMGGTSVDYEILRANEPNEFVLLALDGTRYSGTST